MDGASLAREIEVAVRLVREAAWATEQIRKQGIQETWKADGSPLTQADIVSQALLLRGLKEHFPEDGVAAEESLLPGRESDLRAAASKVLHELGLSSGEGDLEQWVNYKGNPRGARLWMVDPIDGTKGFEKGLCYSVVMGLCVAGRPLFGCMAAPLLPVDGRTSSRTVIAYGGPTVGAVWLDQGEQRPKRMHVSSVDSLARLRLLGSRAHDIRDICGRFMARTGADRLIRLDGQAKYLLLASGQADLYLRSADPSYGIAYPWDHCAGQAILEGAGGRVSDFDGKQVNYHQPMGRPIMDSNGLVASNGRCHAEVLDVVRGIPT